MDDGRLIGEPKYRALARLNDQREAMSRISFEAWCFRVSDAVRTVLKVGDEKALPFGHNPRTV